MNETTQKPAKELAAQAAAEQTHGGTLFTPRVDIYETEHELTLFADLPGVSPEDVDLRYENGELVLRGRVRQRAQPRNALLEEYEEGDFYRAFTIHESIDSSRIAAECKKGVLTVHLPKAEAVKPRKIAIRAE